MVCSTWFYYATQKRQSIETIIWTKYVTQKCNNHRKQGGLFHSSSCFKKGKMRAGLIVYKDWQLATLLLSFQHY